MDNFLITLRFQHFQSDPTIYTQREGTDILILVLYVDDLILTESSSSMIQSVQQNLMAQFDMTDLGISALLSCFAGSLVF
jgi:hypothetical protein